MTVQDDDQLLVCRNSTPYNLKSQNVMAELLDDDLMLVCRNGTPYKATGLDIKESIGPQEAPPSLTSVVLTEDSPGGDRFDNQSFTSTLNWATKGVPESSLEMKATVTGTLDIAGTTDEIVGIEEGAGSFSTTLYNGNNTGQAITSGINNATNGGLVWIKSRDGGTNHLLFDTLRGVNSVLFSNTANDAQANPPLVSFDNNGFSLGSESVSAINQSGVKYVAWNFGKAEGYFDVVEYTGNSATTQSISHSLATRPGFVITKATSGSASSWSCWHTGLTSEQWYITLDDAYAQANGSAATNWAITDTTFDVCNAVGNNADTRSYISYIFAEDTPDVIKCGGYTGVGGGTTVITGFKPQWLMVKNLNANGDWIIFDDKRGVNTGSPAESTILWANEAFGENSSDNWNVDFNDNGFVFTGNNTGTSGANANYIYVAIAESASGPSNTTLTLASDVNLANGVFKAGDAVKQDNSPLVPTSSAITNVSPITAPVYSDYATAADGWYGTQTIEKAFNGINDPDGGAVPNASQPIVYAHPVNVVVEKIELKVYSPVNLTLPDGTVVSVEGNSGQDVWHEGEIPGGSFTFTGSNSISIKESGGGATYFDGIKLNGIELIDNQVFDVLTLQDASGLSDFEVGDQVNAGSTTGPWTETFRQVLYSSEVTPWSDGTATTVSSGDDNISGEAGTQVLMLDRNMLADGDELTFTRTSGSNDFYIRGSETAEANMSWVASTYPTSFTVTRTTSTGVSIPAEQRYIKMMSTGSADSLLYKVEGTAIGAFVSITAIDSAAPSITTDGGDWTVGEVVAGPAKLITATFVSADPSVPSMTVSDVVGPWSANTGNFVENTVVNPIIIKPETSPITNVVAGVSYSATSDMEDAANAFDGNTTTTVSGCKGGSFYNTITTTTFTASEIEIKCNATQGVTDIKVNGGNGYTPIKDGDDPGWFKVTLPQETIVNSLTMAWNQGSSSSIAFNIYGVKADGVLLIDSIPVLTLTDDTDLNQFATGDAVYAAGDAPLSFAPVIYTGNPSGAGRGPVDVGFAPDLVWIKRRNGAAVSHNLMNSLLPDKKLESDTADSAADAGAFAFTSNGFQPSNSYEQSYGDKYVAWCWSAGGTTVTNNEGTIQSQVRSNGQFSIVKYLGNGLATQTVGIGLNSAPKMMIVKDLTLGINWVVWHEDLGPTGYIRLNAATAASTDANRFSQAPSSTLMYIGNSDEVNYNNTTEYIAYCWADSPTQSFGSYTGDGSASGPDTGPVIDCGFEPAFVMIKSHTAAGGWVMFDTARTSSDPNSVSIEANLPDEEVVYSPRQISFTSTGFEVAGADYMINSLDVEYIYAAFSSAGGPSGVVGDITGLDMTLSESTGTWEVGQTVTMDEKPAIETTANLIFDSTGAVTGLSTQPVAGQLMSDKDTPTLTFGDGAGTGETWDEELPEGTHLQTSFVATNVEGTSSATSNEITP